MRYGHRHAIGTRDKAEHRHGKFFWRCSIAADDSADSPHPCPLTSPRFSNFRDTSSLPLAGSLTCYGGTIPVSLHRVGPCSIAHQETRSHETGIHGSLPALPTQSRSIPPSLQASFSSPATTPSLPSASEELSEVSSSPATRTCHDLAACCEATIKSDVGRQVQASKVARHWETLEKARHCCSSTRRISSHAAPKYSIFMSSPSQVPCLKGPEQEAIHFPQAGGSEVHANKAEPPTAYTRRPTPMLMSSNLINLPSSPKVLPLLTNAQTT